ncbi:MAG: hypothetical protein Kow0059_03390 [Candidatus Sumerlaeia bacterium]
MTWRRPAAAAVVFVVLAAVFVIGEVHRREAARAREHSEQLLPTESQRAVRLEIEKDDGRIVLERGDQGWRMTHPIDCRADQGRVTSILNVLDAALVMHRFPAQRLSDYGLDKPALECAVSFENGDAVHLLIGRDAPQPHKTYAMIRGQNEIFLITRSLRQQLERSVFDFRDKSLLDAPPEEVIWLRLVNAAGTLEARHDPAAGQWQMERPAARSADGDRLNALLRRMQTSKALAFVQDDYLTSAPAWFRRPVAVLTVVRRQPLSDGPTTATLIVGAHNREADAWYARHPGSNEVFVIGEEAVEALTQAPDQFRDKRLFSLRPADVAELEMRLGKGHYLLRRSGGRWVFDDDPGVTVNVKAVELLLENLLSLQAESFEADDVAVPAEFGLDPPRMTAIVRPVDGSEQGVEVGARATDRPVVYVRRLGENSVLGLKWTLLGGIYKFREDLTDKHLLEPGLLDRVTCVVTTEGNDTRLLKLKGQRCFVTDEQGKTLSEVSLVSALDYVTAFEALQYYRRVPEGEVSAADAGLDHPVFSVRLLEAEGGEAASFEFGAMMDDKIFLRFNGDEFYLVKLDDWKDLTALYHRLTK